jgi:hypothetical protein
MLFPLVSISRSRVVACPAMGANDARRRGIRERTATLGQVVLHTTYYCQTIRPLPDIYECVTASAGLVDTTMPDPSDESLGYFQPPRWGCDGSLIQRQKCPPILSRTKYLLCHMGFS